MKEQKEKLKQKQLKGARGITLIALVITIIVLLILAAVSIATLTGDNGILTKAQTAKEKNDEAEKEETAKLSQAEANMSFEETEYNGVKIPAGMAPTRKEGESTVDEGLVAVDKNGNEWVWVEVPKSQSKMPENLTFENETGYAEADQAKCNSITSALKTYAAPYTQGSATQNYSWTDEWYDKYGTTYDGENEYSEVTYIKYSNHFTNAKEYYGTIYKDNIGTEEATSYTSGTKYYAKITEKLNDASGCGLTYTQYKENYQKMIKSMYKNGGFWIGRYEAGIYGTTGTDEESLKLGRTSSSARIDISTSPKAISQKDAIPYNFVYCSEAQKLAKEMTPDSSKTSSLLFGIQWDLVCKFIEEKEVKKQGGSNRESIIASINSDSGEWGNYSDKLYSVESGKYTMYAPWVSSDINDWQIILSTFQKQALTYPDICGTLFSTGITERNKKVNIYDFAGNESECTLEHATADTGFPCSNRGGSFLNLGSVSASYRNNSITASGGTDNTFRPVLY